MISSSDVLLPFTNIVSVGSQSAAKSSVWVDSQTSCALTRLVLQVERGLWSESCSPCHDD